MNMVSSSITNQNIDTYMDNEEVEKCLLGCLVRDNRTVDRAMGWIHSSSVFRKTSHQILWDAIVNMYLNHEVIDTVTLFDKVKSRGVEISSIIEMVEDIPSAELVDEYAKIVYKHSLIRKVSLDAEELIQATKSGKDIPELLTKMQNSTRELQELQPNRHKSIEAIAAETIETLDNANNIIRFNIPSLDEPSGGMTRKEITVLGGRPSHGKSTCAVNILHSLLKQNLRVIMFNREMSNTEMLKKMAVLESGISYGKIRHNELSLDEKAHLVKTINGIKEKYEKQLILYDDIRSLDETLREIGRVSDMDVIIDDYIQQIKVSSRSDRRFELEEIMNEYKWVAKSYNCSIVLLSQLNREIEKRVLDPRPRMSDFAESGAIEQVAENALFVFYGYVFNHEQFGEYEYELIFSKVRYGKVGTYRVGFNGDRCKLYSSPEAAALGD